MINPKLGDVFIVDFGDNSCSVQSGIRPALVIQNNIGNYYSPNIIVLPLTSKIKKTNQATHVLLDAHENGLSKDSMVLCENPECISKESVVKYVTTLSNDKMAEIAEAFTMSIPMIMFFNIASLNTVWRKTRLINSN